MSKVLIIAECGWNWNGDLNMARELIRAAKSNGADIVKFQAYDVNKIKALKDDNYYGLKNCQLKRSDVLVLNETAKEVGIEFGLSVFDLQRLAWAQDIDLKRWKIASRCIYDTNLINAMTATKKPLIASTANWREPVLPDFEADFLFCKSRRNLIGSGFTSDMLPKEFNSHCGYTGFSDHTIGLDYAKLAIDRGATIIEKHFTFDKNLPGWDQACSMVPDELAELVCYVNG